MARRASAPNPEWAQAREAELRLKREAVLRAASRLLNEHGYAGTSLADVAARLNVTNNALYHYFESKEDLVYQCYLRAAGILDDALAAASSAANGLERMVGFVRNTLECARVHGALPNASQFFALSPEHQAVLRERERTRRAALRGFVEEGIRDGSVRPCDAALMVTLVIGAVYSAYADPDAPHSEPAELREKLLDFVHHSLAAPPRN